MRFFRKLKNHIFTPQYRQTRGVNPSEGTPNGGDPTGVPTLDITHITTM